MGLRNPNSDELRLIRFLIENAGDGSIVPVDINQLKVESMNDGDMGSLRIFPNMLAPDKKDRIFGKAVSECAFKDLDGVKVIATLHLDKKGNIFELDIWKTDFGKLIKIPDSISLMLE